MDVKEYLEKKKEFDDFVKKQGGGILKDFIKAFFDENPEVTGLRWHQYTPYFMDGDPCVFSVNDIYLSVTEIKAEDETEEDPEESDIWMSSWNTKKISKTLKKNHEAFSNTLSGVLEDLCETAFGDHVEIFAIRKKDTIVFRVEEYSHE